MASASEQIAACLGLTGLTPPTPVGTPFEGSAFAVQDAADQSVGAAVAAARMLAETRHRPVADLPTTLDRDHTITSFSGHLLVNGERPPIWADLSGLYQAADGRHLQLHCNFPHHAEGVVSHLGTSNDRSMVEAAILERDAFELEAELIDRGMIAAACRSLDEWRRHPHAVATDHLPLLDVVQLGEARPRPLIERGAGPTEGIRVLDFSRVLAGPVCGQTLAAGGADVLRVGAAHLPSVPVCVMGTGFGKRNAYVDLDQPAGQSALTQLLEGADIVVDAYRPGALGAKGLSPERIASISPGAVVVQVCAFDWVGPWANRRGFDSIVQSTTGVVMAGAEAAGVEGPTPLPFQALDYATGFLAAAAAMATVVRQQQQGGTWLVRLSLLRTRNWLLSLGGPTPFVPRPLPDPAPWLRRVESDFGALDAPAPVFGQWHRPPAELGSSAAEWGR